MTMEKDASDIFHFKQNSLKSKTSNRVDIDPLMESIRDKRVNRQVHH